MRQSAWCPIRRWTRSAAGMNEPLQKIKKISKKYLHYVKTCSILSFVRETQKFQDENDKDGSVVKRSRR